MRRREGSDDEQSGERPDWMPWLIGVLTDRGYDMSERGGGRAQLARDAGLSAAIIARLMDGKVPAYESQRALSRATGIPLPELLVRTGKATADDFPHSGTDSSHIEVSSGKPLTPEELAVRAGVPEGDRDWFATMIRRIKRGSNGDDDSASGGAAAEG